MRINLLLGIKKKIDFEIKSQHDETPPRLLFEDLEAAFINFKEKFSTFLVVGTFLSLQCPSHLELLDCTNWAKIISRCESSSFLKRFLVSGEAPLELTVKTGSSCRRQSEGGHCCLNV